MKVGLPLMRNVLTQLAKSMLKPLAITTVAAAAADAKIYKKNRIWDSYDFWFRTTALMISSKTKK